MSQHSTALVGVLTAVALGACAHGSKLVSAEEMRSTAESFHERIRWRDYRGAAELLIPGRRARPVHFRLRARAGARLGGRQERHRGFADELAAPSLVD